MLARLRKHRKYHPELSEAQANAASVWDCPLPEGPAQLVLIALCLTGHDCCVYRSAAGWNVWIGELAHVRPEKEGRVPLTEWEQHYAAILAEFYHAESRNADA